MLSSYTIKCYKCKAKRLFIGARFDGWVQLGLFKWICEYCQLDIDEPLPLETPSKGGK